MNPDSLYPNLLSAICKIVWLLSAIKGISLYSYYWQLKEYRFDRMREFLSSPKGKALLTSPLNFFRLLVAGLILGSFFNRLDLYLTIALLAAVVALGLISLIRLIINFRHHNFFRPKLTFKMALILGAALLLEALAIFMLPNITVLALEVIRPILVTLLMIIIGIPFWFLKKHVMSQATKKRLHLPNLKVIGITGSYGKSSTKEFLCQIIQHHFITAKTPKHINVDIGIAQTLLNAVDEATEVFVVEMGAYRQGEIASSCRIAKPEIGIMTGVNEQHMSFFGSLENTIKAKGELLASLPKSGTAIVNSDSQNALETLHSNRAEKIIRYSMQTKADLYADNIEQSASSLSFQVHYKNQSAKFSAPIFGQHFVQNLLAAIACALELGLTLEQIAKSAESCTVLEGSLQISENTKKITIINDSYNSNPDGFIAALSAAQSLKSKKTILVTMGMMELGAKSEELHEKVAQKIAAVCDTVFITSTDVFETLSKAIKESNQKIEVHLTTDFAELIKEIEAEISAGDAILFENRVPKSVIDHFQNPSK